MSAPSRVAYPRIWLLGTQLTTFEGHQILAAIETMIESGRKGIVLSGNVHSFNLAYRQGWLRGFFNRADVVRLDGAGLRLGAKVLGYSTPGRTTWADFAWDLADLAQASGYALFLLGARSGIAEEAAIRLRGRFPKLRIVGTHHGYFDKTPGSSENELVIRKINGARPNILIVGFGMPLQERWLMQNWDHIKANVALTGGGVFDYVSGRLTRGPRWMTSHGLEWLARLVIEPRRLWRRYLIGNPLFLWRILKQRFGLLHFEDAFQ